MNRELLLLADVLAKEKNVDIDVVFTVLEQALAQATARFYNHEWAVRVVIDRYTGAYESFRGWSVVADEDGLQNPESEILLFEASEKTPDAQVGDLIEEPIESIAFSRIGAQAAKQVIMQKIREAEREQVIQTFLETGERIFHGTVKRIERNGDAWVEQGRLEARIPRDHLIAKETFRPGDRIRALVLRVDQTPRGSQLLLSRTSPDFLVALFTNEVPEIRQDLLQIKAAAREPGVRAKLLVHATDRRIDPIGTCIGVRGSRTQAVSNELAGERTDIVVWNDDLVHRVIAALAPANISSITVDEEKNCVDVVADDANLALAIGRNGQNVRLASELLGTKIRIFSMDEASQKKQLETNRISKLFMEKLDVDITLANLLMEEGFTSLEEVAYVDEQEMLAIEALDPETVSALRERAANAFKVEQQATEAKLTKVEPELRALDGMDDDLAAKLGGAGVTSLRRFSKLSYDEFGAILALPEERAAALIENEFADVTDEEMVLIDQSYDRRAKQVQEQAWRYAAREAAS